jgi:hypothetical protein
MLISELSTAPTAKAGIQIARLTIRSFGSDIAARVQTRVRSFPKMTIVIEPESAMNKANEKAEIRIPHALRASPSAAAARK